MKLNHKILTERQAWPLDRKIEESKKRIIEWYHAWDGMVSVVFSGGRDSTVLLHLVRSVFPEVPGVFCNTGLEYPENVRFVKTIENVKVIRPAMPFHKVIEKWGYPVVSKHIAKQIFEVQSAKGYTATKHLRLTGIKSDGTYSKLGKISEKWQYLINGPFKISDKCCNELKKKPAKRYDKESGTIPFVGTMAEESKGRVASYLMRGCNAYDGKRPRSAPLSFWLQKDIIDYLNLFKVQYSPIYDKGYQRTGCMWCMFGVHLEYQQTGTNRFIRMEQTHPRHWDYCINRLGIGRVMDFIGVPYEDKQMKLFEPTTGTNSQSKEVG